MRNVFTPLLSEADKSAVVEALEEGWISSGGPYVTKFQNALSEKFNRAFTVCMNSGTSALEAAIHALDIEEGDEVILPSFTIVSCVNAIIANGGTPVFIDIEKNTWNLDISLVENAISRKTKAVLCVHMYGQPCKILELEKICKSHEIFLIEDASQAHGAIVEGLPCGSFGDISIFSFYANKIITTGEGGAALTNSDILCKKLEGYRNLYFDKERKFIHQRLGKNFRMTALQAALGTSQLYRLDELVNRRRVLGETYIEMFKDLPIRKSIMDRGDRKCVYWMNAFEFLLKGDRRITELITILHREGFETRHFFSCLDTQPFLNEKISVQSSMTESRRAEQNGIYFPSSHLVTRHEIQKMAEILHDFLN